MLKEKWNKLVNLKYFHVCVIAIIIFSMLLAVGFISLRYNVEGETNMPFIISKISIISSSGGINKEIPDAKWAYDIYQLNDIYLYIDKNKGYGKTEAIKSIVIDNIQIEAKNKDNIKIYKPDAQDEKQIFINKEENETTTLEYLGEMESNIKTSKISNQGGVIAFRCSNNNVAEYKTSDETVMEIAYDQLLKSTGITSEDLKINLTFDLSINLEEGKEYKTTINLELPTGNVIENGTQSIEITNLDNYIFKRTKN